MLGRERLLQRLDRRHPAAPLDAVASSARCVDTAADMLARRRAKSPLCARRASVLSVSCRRVSPARSLGQGRCPVARYGSRRRPRRGGRARHRADQRAFVGGVHRAQPGQRHPGRGKPLPGLVDREQHRPDRRQGRGGGAHVRGHGRRPCLLRTGRGGTVRAAGGRPEPHETDADHAAAGHGPVRGAGRLGHPQMLEPGERAPGRPRGRIRVEMDASVGPTTAQQQGGQAP